MCIRIALSRLKADRIRPQDNCLNILGQQWCRVGHYTAVPMPYSSKRMPQGCRNVGSPHPVKVLATLSSVPCGQCMDLGSGSALVLGAKAYKLHAGCYSVGSEKRFRIMSTFVTKPDVFMTLFGPVTYR